MNRREFLKCCTLLGVSLTLRKTTAYAKWLPKDEGSGFPQGMLLIDAHAHPDQLYYLGPREGQAWENWCKQSCDESSTLEEIMELGMQDSSFAAVGDGETTVRTMGDVMQQIQKVISLEEQNLVRIVRRPEDVVLGGSLNGFIPGAILSLEGASPLGSNKDTVFENLRILYDSGVRMITVMHYNDNQFGQAMKQVRGKTDGDGLSDLGEEVVERMMELGIIVDVAHAHYPTLRDMVEIAKVNNIPLIDSHTSLSPCKTFCGSRLRTWEEMEMIASTGGLICTWPLKWERSGKPSRLTIYDWAEENYEMKQRLGSQHIGLGTDGGGILPERVEGYASILDLPKLVDAMDEVGFKTSEIEAYMGGNLSQLINQCMVARNFTSISVTPTSYDFLAVKVRKSKTASFVVKNNGKVNLSITSSTITGTDASMFKITSGSGNKTIKPGKSLTIKVAFKPTSTGSKSAILEISSNDPAAPTIDIPLSGTGQ